MNCNNIILYFFLLSLFIAYDHDTGSGREELEQIKEDISIGRKQAALIRTELTLAREAAARMQEEVSRAKEAADIARKLATAMIEQAAPEKEERKNP